MSRLVVLDHANGTVRGKTDRDAPHGRDLIDALRAVANDVDSADAVAWRDTTQTELTEPTTWQARLDAHGPVNVVLHLGFDSTPPQVLRRLQAVAGEDPFVVPSGSRRLTWLMGSAAGIARAGTLRAMLDDPSDSVDEGSVAHRLSRLGLESFEGGIVPWHDHALGHATPTDAWSRSDVRSMITRRWGRTRRGPIALARLRPPRASASVRIPPPKVLSVTERENDHEHDPDSVDVVIPTLERPGPLADVLTDLARQTRSPDRVVIIEQRPGAKSSGLNDLAGRDWPFTLVLETVHWTGASRARNRAIRATRAPWIALLDDDVRLAPNLLESMIHEAERCGADALSVREHSAPTAGDPDDDAIDSRRPPRPRLGLGSGRALVRRRALVAVGGFDRQIEGWGEDMDLGLRLNHAGYAVLESRRLAIIHLKAPRGGFRAPRSAARRSGPVPPLPSPLIVYRWRRFMPDAMLAGTVRSHLVRAVRHHPLRVLALPWLWLRYRAANGHALRMLDQGPRLLDLGDPTS